MTDYSELVEALRCCAGTHTKPTKCPDYGDSCGCGGKCLDKHLISAADAIEALQAEVQFYDALADEWKSSAENKERLLGLYRAEQAKHFYSAMDDNGRIITNQCACMNISVFSDCSENPNS